MKKNKPVKTSSILKKNLLKLFDDILIRIFQHKKCETCLYCFPQPKYNNCYHVMVASFVRKDKNIKPANDFCCNCWTSNKKLNIKCDIEDIKNIIISFCNKIHILS